MLSDLTGSTTVHQLPDPFARRPGLLSTGRAEVRVILKTHERPAADQEPRDSASRSVPQTPQQGG
jgi:hypothetical protein